MHQTPAADVRRGAMLGRGLGISDIVDADDGAQSVGARSPPPPSAPLSPSLADNAPEFAFRGTSQAPTPPMDCKRSVCFVSLPSHRDNATLSKRAPLAKTTGINKKGTSQQLQASHALPTEFPFVVAKLPPASTLSPFLPTLSSSPPLPFEPTQPQPHLNSPPRLPRTETTSFHSTIMSRQQQRALQAYFQVNPYPTVQMQLEIALAVDAPVRAVSAWFKGIRMHTLPRLRPTADTRLDAVEDCSSTASCEETRPAVMSIASL
ncbi:hypothetical protein BC830DRAFT_1135004, partial [Chytriomyces sp. MP71]